jgi:hypothetical protein
MCVNKHNKKMKIGLKKLSELEAKRCSVDKSKFMKAILVGGGKANVGEVLQARSPFSAYSCLTVVCLQTMRRSKGVGKFIPRLSQMFVKQTTIIKTKSRPEQCWPNGQHALWHALASCTGGP